MSNASDRKKEYETLAWITDDEAEFWTNYSPSAKKEKFKYPGKKSLVDDDNTNDGLYFNSNSMISPGTVDHLSVLYNKGMKQQDEQGVEQRKDSLGQKRRESLIRQGSEGISPSRRESLAQKRQNSLGQQSSEGTDQTRNDSLGQQGSEETGQPRKGSLGQKRQDSLGQQGSNKIDQERKDSLGQQGSNGIDQPRKESLGQKRQDSLGQQGKDKTEQSNGAENSQTKSGAGQQYQEGVGSKDLAGTNAQGSERTETLNNDRDVKQGLEGVNKQKKRKSRQQNGELENQLIDAAGDSKKKDTVTSNENNQFKPKKEDRLSLAYKENLEKQAKDVEQNAEQKQISEIFEFDQDASLNENVPGVNMSFLDRLLHQLTRPRASIPEFPSDDEFSEIDESEITAVNNDNAEKVPSKTEKKEDVPLTKSFQTFIEELIEETDVIRGNIDEGTLFRRRTEIAKNSSMKNPVAVRPSI